jgi:hypothetical protein
MKASPLAKGTIIRTVVLTLELIALVMMATVTLTNDGESVWGYWGVVLIEFGVLSPVYVYVIASAVFNAFNFAIVFQKRHTVESIKKYYKISKVYLIWGCVTGALYGCLLVPIFLLENVFLYIAYEKELKQINNT